MQLETREFEQAVNRMAELSRREPAIVVRNMARDYTRAVLEATPLAKPTWWKRIDRPDGRTVWIRKDKPTRPRGTGFARAGWVKSRIWSAITKANRYAKNQEEYADKDSGLEDRLQDFFASVTLENRVPYIGELDARENIETQGIAKAVDMLNRGIESYEKKLQEANR